MEHGFDIVAVGIDQEGGEIARVVGPVPRLAVIAATRLKTCLVEGLDLRLVRRLEGEVDTGR